jgi:ElaB/YqjD/DUF883 family membrane-anchored ribosome-binding protein
MADEIRVARSSGSNINDDPEATRAEIEQTRRRMSSTIDELGDVLQRKKGQIQERLDVMAPVRENPLRTVGLVFGAGLALGLLTGGGDEEEEHLEHRTQGRMRGSDSHWRNRSEMWEGRARRLLRIAREQDEELESMRATRHPSRSRRSHFDEEEEYDGGPRRARSLRHMRHEAEERFDDLRDRAGERFDDLRDTAESRFDDLRDTVAHAVSGFVSNAVRQFARSMTD